MKDQLSRFGLASLEVGKGLGKVLIVIAAGLIGGLAGLCVTGGTDGGWCGLLFGTVMAGAVLEIVSPTRPIEQTSVETVPVVQ